MDTSAIDHQTRWRQGQHAGGLFQTDSDGASPGGGARPLQAGTESPVSSSLLSQPGLGLPRHVQAVQQARPDSGAPRRSGCRRNEQVLADINDRAISGLTTVPASEAGGFPSALVQRSRTVASREARFDQHGRRACQFHGPQPSADASATGPGKHIAPEQVRQLRIWLPSPTVWFLLISIRSQVGGQQRAALRRGRLAPAGDLGRRHRSELLGRTQQAVGGWMLLQLLRRDTLRIGPQLRNTAPRRYPTLPLPHPAEVLQSSWTSQDRDTCHRRQRCFCQAAAQMVQPQRPAAAAPPTSVSRTQTAQGFRNVVAHVLERLANGIGGCPEKRPSGRPPAPRRLALVR